MPWWLPLLYLYYSVSASLLSNPYLIHAYNVAWWVKISDDILKYFSYIFQIIGFLSLGDNLHKMSNPIFWKNKEKYHQFVIC